MYWRRFGEARHEEVSMGDGWRWEKRLILLAPETPNFAAIRRFQRVKRGRFILLHDESLLMEGRV